MLKIITFLISMSFVSVTFAANTQVGVLDVQKVMGKLSQVDGAVAKIRKQFVPQEKALKNEQQVLQADIVKYNKLSAKMRSAELKRWQRKIALQQKKLQKNQDAFKEKLLLAKNLEVQKIVAHLSTIVTTISQSRDLDVVLFKDAVVYNGPMLDIAGEVSAVAASKKKV